MLSIGRWPDRNNGRHRGFYARGAAQLLFVSFASFERLIEPFAAQGGLMFKRCGKMDHLRHLPAP